MLALVILVRLLSFRTQKDTSMSAVDIDIDDDVTSSLNTLLDTRQEDVEDSSQQQQQQTVVSTRTRTECCKSNNRVVNGRSGWGTCDKEVCTCVRMRERRRKSTESAETMSLAAVLK